MSIEGLCKVFSRATEGLMCDLKLSTQNLPKDAVGNNFTGVDISIICVLVRKIHILSKGFHSCFSRKCGCDIDISIKQSTSQLDRARK